MSPTSIPPPPPPFGQALIQLIVIRLYWWPRWWLIKFRTRLKTMFWTMLGRGPRRPGGKREG
jgi:hypothetical protein